MDDLRAAFRPADFTWQARVHLSKTNKISSDVDDYVAPFNVAYNYCIDISSHEAQFFFEQNLWAEIYMQVLANLQEAQEIATRISSMLKTCRQLKPKGKQPNINFEHHLQHRNNSSHSQQSGRGHAPIVLGQVTGGYQQPQQQQSKWNQGQKPNATCYRCGKQRHYKCDCKDNLEKLKRGHIDLLQGQQGDFQAQQNVPPIQNNWQGSNNLCGELDELKQQLSTIANVLLAQNQARTPLNQQINSPSLHL